jgi:hypothetical protein
LYGLGSWVANHFSVEQLSGYSAVATIIINSPQPFMLEDETVTPTKKVRSIF